MNVLKKSVEATTITKRILDLRISFIVSKLPASGPVVKKQLTKPISHDKAI